MPELTDDRPRAEPGRPRNDLPEFRPYRYRGLGYDQLDPRIDPRINRRCTACGYLRTSPGHRVACDA